MSDDTTQGETPEEYAERIRSVPGIYSDYNETAASVVDRPARLVEDAEVRALHTDLAPEVHPEDNGGEQQDAVGYVYPGTDFTEVPKEETKEEEPEAEEEPVEEPAEEPEPVEETPAELPAEEQAGQPSDPAPEEPAEESTGEKEKK